MASAEQDVTGKWKIKVKLTSQSPNVRVNDVTFTYDGVPVTFYVTKTERTIETPWETALGVDLDPTKLTKSYPTFTDGNTRYVPGQDSITTIPYNS